MELLELHTESELFEQEPIIPSNPNASTTGQEVKVR